RHAQYRHARTRLRRPARARQRGARAAHRAQQLVRIRRQQLQPRVRGGRRRGMSTLTLHLEGIGWWSAGVADWSALAARLRAGDGLPVAAPPARPPAAVLPPNERRRAPELVLLACE